MNTKLLPLVAAIKKILITVLASPLAISLLAQIPTDSLSLWLKADKGVVVSGTNVKEWKDQSGNNFHAATTSVTPPQLVSNELNGLPVIRFNGLDNAMETVSFQTFPNKRGTVIVVVKVRGLGSTSGVGYGTFVSTYYNKGITWQMGSKGPLSIYYDGEGSSGFPVAEMSVGKWAVVSLRRESDTIMQYLRDGTVRFPFRISNNQPDVNPLKIASNGRLEVLNGDIAEIIVYGRVIDEKEMNSIYGYFNKKYQLAFRSPDTPTQKWWLYALLLLPVLGTAIIITKYIAQRKLKKQLAELERLRELDKERQRISREMHDDIGSGLTQIVMMSESVKSKMGSNGEKELSDITDTSRKLVNSMSEIIWSLSPENKTLDQLFAYLREQLNKQLEYSGMNHKIDLPENGNNISLSNEQRRNILLITKEIVNNAIKYSSANNILIQAEIKNNSLAFFVEDDGKGFDINKIYGGNGLKNIKSRIEELGGKMETDSEPGKGSRFKYSISL